MIARQICSCLTITSLIVGFGLAAAHAEPTTATRNSGADASEQFSDTKHPSKDRANQSPSFIYLGSMQEFEVVNGNRQSLGTISDAIVERGSGDIKYLLLSHGGTLGVGETETAIPYSAFVLPEKISSYPQFVINVTPEQIEKAPSFDPSSFSELQYHTWQDDVSDFFQAIGDVWSDEADENHVTAIVNGKPQEIEGRVQKVERISHGLSPQTIVVTVRPEDASDSKKVHLGPAWYVMTQHQTPVRGKDASITAYPAPDANYAYIATSVQYDDGEVVLRNEESGQPRWDASETTQDEATLSKTKHRYLLASQLMGADVIADGEDAGHVQNLIVECYSGQVAFLAVDPDQDTFDQEWARLAPWGTARITSEGEIWLNISKSDLLKRESLPKDKSQINDPGFYKSVYKNWEMNSPEFEPIHHESWDAADVLGGWSRDGKFIAAVDDGKRVTLTGKIVDMKTIVPAKGVADALAVIVQSGDNKKTVLLGPSWYFERQSLSLIEGDQVIIDTIQAEYDGRTIYTAVKIETDDKAYSFRDGNGRPVWDAS